MQKVLETAKFRIPLLGKHLVQALAIEFGFLGELCRPSLSLSDIPSCEQKEFGSSSPGAALRQFSASQWGHRLSMKSG
jgi:hypothetical protein